MASYQKGKRSWYSLAVLLLLVLAVTVQLVTGALLWSGFQRSLLSVHLRSGIATACLLGLEWIWLSGTSLGRDRLRVMFSSRALLDQRLTGWFLAVATLATILGLLLAGTYRFGWTLPVLSLLTAHRWLAAVVGVLWLVHALLAARRPRATRSD